MSKKTFSIGDRVEHKLFGKGTVMEVEDGDKTKLTISFAGDIHKKIIANFIKHV